MNDAVYIRPLVPADALISYEWRNNPKIWRFTGTRPTTYITPEIEMEWIMKVLQRPDEKRFAICCHNNNRYIGNIFFTDIDKGEAQMHIFIGDINFWGGDRAYQAICQIIEFGFNEIALDTIYSYVNPSNLAAIRLGLNAGFEETGSFYDVAKDMMLTRIEFTRAMYNRQQHLKKEVKSGRERST
ncbi:GNAT family N-acetyltransferase [Pseudoflavitalea rhizosphaerae]|uniref:GNAT family N-acetyltransferase n=1 Tax=Pseudoflavitalea rhizosphaerae TaxID=1884793 RepID=UPI000F8DDBFB|nr:GNAT family N-acetyltransferase [Pseudoflavitalea rhizosphaerae]